MLFHGNRNNDGRFRFTDHVTQKATGWSTNEAQRGREMEEPGSIDELGKRRDDGFGGK